MARVLLFIAVYQLRIGAVMKKFHPLFGFILCLSFVSFAPMSLLVDDGRAPASNETPKPQVETKRQLFVFGPLIIYQRSERIKEVRTEYARLQSDVDLIAKQKAEIERLLSNSQGSMQEISKLKKELGKLTASYNQTKSELEKLRTDFDAERAALAAEIEALVASNEASEAEKAEALALLEQERSLAQNLSNDIASLTRELELKDAELTETKSMLEEAQAEVLAKEEELKKIKCENEGAIASLREDIKKIEKERDDISVMMDTLRLDYEQQMTHQQMQQQQMMMAMYMFSYQSMLTPQGNPYLQQSSVFDPSYQMMHIQQAQLVKQMNNMQYKPQVVNNYYGSYTGMYGNGGDFMEANPYELNHFNMFANNTVDLNANTSMPASIQANLMPGYFSF